MNVELFYQPDDTVLIITSSSEANTQSANNVSAVIMFLLQCGAGRLVELFMAHFSGISLRTNTVFLLCVGISTPALHLATKKKRSHFIRRNTVIVYEVKKNMKK